jgi:hypothetical protein
MKEYTIIWVDDWMTGSHRHSIRHSMTKKTFVRSNSIEDIMISNYGDRILYLFDGFIFTHGETLDESLVQTI